MKMIDVGAKPRTERLAVARGSLSLSAATSARVRPREPKRVEPD